ncbi:MAG: MlaD family protein [Thermoleophilaceae bacterium]|jgi:virulence factor Mce-like protein
MTRGRGTASIVASPVLVGAVTVLIVVVSVFLAYNANQGLPFVPTYDVKAQLPGGANLVRGNEVRAGGFRVGVIDKIDPGVAKVGGRTRSIAIVHLKLDKTIEPLAKDTRVLVRPRSALGLKYIELTPGHSQQTFKQGDTIPVAQAGQPVEFDDFLNTFDTKTQQNSQESLTGFGDAFSGRGEDVNTAIENLGPFFRYLEPVMKNLSAPDTHLDEFFKQIGRASAQVAPVAHQQAEIFTNQADTFDAIIHNTPQDLQQTIEKNPPTEDTAIASFRVQRPFLANFADLSRRLRPAAKVLPSALPKLNTAFKVGIPVLKRSPDLNNATAKTFDALDQLVQNPNTGLGLQDLRTLASVTAPMLAFVAPYQIVCSSFNHFWEGLGGHISEETGAGTAERVLLKDDGQETQNGKMGSDNGTEPADVTKAIAQNGNDDPTTAVSKDPPFAPLEVIRGTPYAAAVDAHGNADCEGGQFGWVDGPINPPWTRLHPGQYGGSHTISVSNFPTLAGPTWDGVKSLKDVP